MPKYKFLAFKTIYIKEVRRFLKVYNQTVFAPAVTAVLFLSVFSLAIGNRVQEIEGVPFIEFMVAGIIMMTLVQNAFANTSSSLTMGKVLGNIIDYLLPPLHAREIVFGIALAGITRGLITGIVVAITAQIFFTDLSLHNFWLMIFYAVAAAALLSVLGMIAGIFSETFDRMSAITSYVITPLSFLSGTFYSVKSLPKFWQEFNMFNPFFYMIDGFRYSLTGHADGNLLTGAIVLMGANIVLYYICYSMFKNRYRLRDNMRG